MRNCRVAAEVFRSHEMAKCIRLLSKTITITVMALFLPVADAAPGGGGGPPVTPTGLSATPSSVIHEPYTITWNQTSNTTYYDLQEQIGTYAWYTSYSGSSRSIEYQVRPPNTYKYRVRACHYSNGCSNYSSTITVNAQNVPITQVISLDGDYHISWATRTGITEFKLEERKNGGSWSTVYSGGTATSKAITGKTTGEYEYRLIECFGSCNSATDASMMYVDYLSGGVSDPEDIVTGTFAGSTPFQSSVSRKGDAQITIPIQVPNGVNGTRPNLVLGYSSGGENILAELNKTEGVLGYGWSLGGIPEIRRCRVGVGGEIEHDDTDILCLNGNALEMVSGTNYWTDDSAEYRTELDTQVKIIAQGTGETNRSFKIYFPNGHEMVLGDSFDSRVVSPDTDENANALPYLWSPTLYTDDFGNEIDYEWRKIESNGTNFLRFIEYANAEIELIYDDRCSDLTNCDTVQVQSGENVPGVKARAVVLNRILTKVDSNTVNDYVLKNTYDDGYLRLEKVQHCGYTEAGSLDGCMKPLEFRWDTLTIEDTNPVETLEQIVVDQITNGFGDKTNFEYAVINGYSASNHVLHLDVHPEFYGTWTSIDDYQYSPRQKALVQYHKKPDGDGAQTTSRHRYQGYPMYSKDDGRGYLGFPSTQIEIDKNKMQNGTTETHFDGRIRHSMQYRMSFPYIGRLARHIQDVDTDASGNTLMSRVSKQMYDYDMPSSSGSQTSDPYLTTAFNITNELLATGSDGYSNATKTTYTRCFRALVSGACPGSGTLYEHATQLVTTTENALYMTAGAGDGTLWGGVLGSASPSGIVHYTEQKIEYSNDETSWELGFVEEIQSGAGLTLSTLETSKTELDADATYTTRPEKIRIYDTNSALLTTTDITYDAYGNTTNSDLTGTDLSVSTISSSASTFSDNMYPTSVTNSESHTSAFAYDLRFGTVDSVTDANSDITTTTRDAFGRVKLAEGPDGTEVTITYADCTSGCTAVTWATPRLKITKEYKNGSTQVAPDEVTYLDSAGNVVLSETEAFSSSDGWVRVESEYDEIGKLIKQSLPYFSIGGTAKYVEYFYDYKGRVKFVSKPDGSDVTTDIYADVGTGGYVNVEVDIDLVEASTVQTKKSRFNRLGQLFDTTDGFGSADAVTTEYTYTVNGQLDTVEVDGTEVADIDYDDALNRASIDEPNSGVTSFDYYSNGWLKEITDANSHETLYDYDALGRVVERLDGNEGGTPDVTNTWEWDAIGAKGLLKSRDIGTEFSETYAYDTSGRLDTITAAVDVSGFSDNGNYVIDYDYDAYGRLADVTYPNSIQIDYEYLSTGYLSKVKKGAATLHEYTDVDAFGNIIGEEYGNGLATARDYDSETGSLTSIETGTSGTPKSVQDLIYEWESNGALLERTNQKNTVTTSDDIVESFTYDDIGRLENSDTNTSGRTLTQTFDDHGNILTKLSDISGDLDVTSYSYPTSTKPHRLASVTIAGISNTLTYDSAGNITKYDATSGDDTYIGYDDANRVTKITVGSSSTDSTPTARDEFWYGPDGQRFLRKASWMDGSLKSSWTLYLLGGTFEEVHPEHDSTIDYQQRVLITANVQHQYIKPSSGSATTSIDYVHRDHIGSITARSNSSGTVLSEVDFDPFGLQRGANWDRDQSLGEKGDREDEEDTFTARGFTGHEMLNRTGFVHMNGRVYDPRIGRFIQPDPVVGRPANSQSYNRYAYVLNSPLSLTDPTGLDSACDRKFSCIGSRGGDWVTTYGGAGDYRWTQYNDYGGVADSGFGIGFYSSPDVGFRVADYSTFDSIENQVDSEPGDTASIDLAVEITIGGLWGSAIDSTFYNGGIGISYNSEGQVVFSASYSRTDGFGRYAGVGAQVGVSKYKGEVPTYFDSSDSAYGEANVGIGPNSYGGSSTLDTDSGSGSISIGRLGPGIGIMLAKGRRTTVTIATPSTKPLQDFAVEGANAVARFATEAINEVADAIKYTNSLFN